MENLLIHIDGLPVLGATETSDGVAIATHDATDGYRVLLDHEGVSLLRGWLDGWLSENPVMPNVGDVMLVKSLAHKSPPRTVTVLGVSGDRVWTEGNERGGGYDTMHVSELEHTHYRPDSEG